MSVIDVLGRGVTAGSSSTGLNVPHPAVWLTFAIPLLVRAHGTCRVVVSVAVEDYMQSSDVESRPTNVSGEIATINPPGIRLTWS